MGALLSRPFGPIRSVPLSPHARIRRNGLWLSLDDDESRKTCGVPLRNDECKLRHRDSHRSAMKRFSRALNPEGQIIDTLELSLSSIVAATLFAFCLRGLKQHFWRARSLRVPRTAVESELFASHQCRISRIDHATEDGRTLLRKCACEDMLCA